MPENKNLKPVKLPMNIKFGEQPKTEFKILEQALNVKLIQYPTEEELKSYIPEFVNATWTEDIEKVRNVNDNNKLKSIVKMFKGKTLPGALETIRFTFLIEGMTYQEVSHILRHRNATFSAVCTGDRFQHFDDVLIPEAIYNNKEYRERYEKIALEAKQLYSDMVNEKKVSLMDARYALPRSGQQTYYMSINYKDLIGFIRQRQDTAIQPKSDNILAYKMWLAVCQAIPLLSVLNIVDFNYPDMFFIKTSRSGHATNLYIPEEKNDKFEWNREDFIYQKTREEMNGFDNTPEDYQSIWSKTKASVEESLEKIKKEYIQNNPNIMDIIYEVENDL